LFFGLTAGALLIVRGRPKGLHYNAGGRPKGLHYNAGDSPTGAIAYAPGHPITTMLFVAVAAGVVLNSFIAYPTQSLIGSAILVVAAAIYFVVNRGHRT